MGSSWLLENVETRIPGSFRLCRELSTPGLEGVDLVGFHLDVDVNDQHESLRNWRDRSELIMASRGYRQQGHFFFAGSLFTMGGRRGSDR